LDWHTITVPASRPAASPFPHSGCRLGLQLLNPGRHWFGLFRRRHSPAVWTTAARRAQANRRDWNERLPQTLSDRQVRIIATRLRRANSHDGIR
jgi:hypothetical protein